MFARKQMLQIPFVPCTEPLLRPNASLRPKLDAERASILFLACAAYRNVVGRRLRILYQTDVVAYCVDNDGEGITAPVFSKLCEGMQKLMQVHDSIPLVNIERATLIDHLRKVGQDDTASVVESLARDEFTCALLDDYLNVCFAPIETSMAKLHNYSMQQYDNGFVMLFPSLLNPETPAKWSGSTNYHSMLIQFAEWAKETATSCVTSLNSVLPGISELNKECVDFSNAQLKAISKQLIDGYPQKRLITIAGPSSSGKSTFSRLIKNALAEAGYDTMIVSMDDFYKMRVNIPFGPDGLKDFECLEAFDVDLLTERLHKLLQGEVVPEHHYSFVTGLNWDEKTPLQLSPKSFLILEGIHGLNPQLLEHLGDDVTKIYVCPMTPLLIDAEHCYPPSELRLLRRIIRDHRSRGYPPRATIRQWTSVRIGEERNITPNIGLADIFFNSSLAYELPVISTVATKLLRDAERAEDDENEDAALEVTTEARQIEGSLCLFKEMTMLEVPKDSCLHEFM